MYMFFSASTRWVHPALELGVNPVIYWGTKIPFACGAENIHRCSSDINASQLEASASPPFSPSRRKSHILECIAIYINTKQCISTQCYLVA